MTSVNTNASATTALRTLQATNKALDTTQNRVSTGLKIGEAKDNAAYWAISTTLKSDNKSLSTVKDALNLGAATVDVAYQGLNKAKDVLDEIQKKLTAATAAGVDKDVIQSEIVELQKQLVSIASSSTFSGENWLSVDSSVPNYNSMKEVVASFSRDANNAVTIGRIQVDISKVALFDANADTTKSGLIDSGAKLTGANGRDLNYGGVAQTGNTVAAGLDVATVAGKDAVKAKSVFGGTFAPTTIDANDKILLAYKADNAASAGDVEINASHVSGTGFATQGVISTQAELVLAVNNALSAAGRTDVEAVVSGSTFALQRTSGDVNKTVEVTKWQGVDPNFTSSTSLAALAPANSTGAVAVAQKITYTIGGTVTTGASTINLGGLGAINYTPAGTATTDAATAIRAALLANSSVTALYNITGTGSDVIVENKTAGASTAPTFVFGGADASNTTESHATTTAGADAIKAFDQATITAGSTVFGDDDDQILFKFTDSAVSGGATQTVEIKLADLVAAGITDKTIDSNDDFTNALRAAFVRKGLTNYAVTNSTATLKIEANSVTAGQTIGIPAMATTDIADTDTALANQLGLTFSATVARGTNAVAAVSTSATALPSGGITLDNDDKIYFDVTKGGSTAKTLVTIDKATINEALTAETAPSVTLGAFNAYGLTAGDTIAFNVEWDGVGASYSITGLAASSTAQQFADAINALPAFAAKGAASVVDGKLVITGSQTGPTHSVKVASVSNTNSFAGSGGLVAGSVSYGTAAKADAGGKIETAGEMAKVVKLALDKANVTGVEVGVVNGRLSLSSAATGAAGGVTISNVAASSGANEISIDKIDISAAGLAASNVKTADEVKQTLSAYISVVKAAITKVTSAAANLGAAASRIDLQNTFVDTLMDTIDKGVGNLIDADLSEESTRLQALQTKQQLGVQALSIANSGTQQILRLFQNN